ncbi:MAG TPA: Gfo/Idh/MocA family oxidoreductase [Kiritimatiellia bacterium]|jgi:predicted dehydrogenase|nr:Gfo/Idh/MocA family oxidoreductase [Kiritimatiellia bacterium]HOR98423.1 Gfo/Idh/MocA family oxidoreductase [Kiritimatiellia bacterium]HRU20482.1 Gfo/Idh/MocA family oxidoreductase [Kiritimatiellia bacterium]
MKMTRRDMMKQAGAVAAVGFPSIIPAKVLGQQAPSKMLTLACVGVGGMGLSHISQLKAHRDRVRIVAVADVDIYHQRRAVRQIDEMNGDRSCRMYTDFREVTRAPDIDLIAIATPDNWHALTAIDAIRHGKDVFVEKPLTLTVREGQALVSELRKHKRIGQTGTMQRSSEAFHHAAELIRNGRLGKIRRIEVLIPANNRHVGATWKPEAVPEGLDYDFWLGPAPYAPYTSQRTHYQFRYILDYAGGQTTNWGAHYLDIAQWALGMDESGPVEAEGHGVFPSSGLFTAPTRVDVRYTYANGVTMRMRTRTDGVYDGNIIFYGDQGTLDVSRSKLKSDPEGILKEKIGAGETRLYKSRNHFGNWIDCVKSRELPVSDLAIGHKTTNLCNIGNIAMQLQRRLVWDPVREMFAGDDMANRMLTRPMRGPWSLA